MNKLIIPIALLFAALSCKGPGSGPLAKDSFKKSENNPHQGMSQSPNSTSPNSTTGIKKIDANITPCKDCIKISDLLENKKNYSGKTIRITGQVTKFNPHIMGKNWVHIQDGSEFQGAFDLTITTDQEVSVGQTITFEGKIVLDKDFGYGYFYNVLMEEAKPISSI